MFFSSPEEDVYCTLCYFILNYFTFKTSLFRNLALQEKVFNISLVFPIRSLIEETADWEKELQQELQEYEVVIDPENRDDNWDREIEEMLQDDS